MTSSVDYLSFIHRWELSHSMILCQVGLSFTGLRSDPFQGVAWRHGDGGMVERAVRPGTLSVKSTMFWMVEGTFHFLASRKVTAELTIRR